MSEGTKVGMSRAEAGDDWLECSVLSGHGRTAAQKDKDGTVSSQKISMSG